MTTRFVLAIDQGTTGSTALLLDDELAVRAKANHEFPQHYPQPGWVEHNPEEIWRSVVDAVADCLGQVDAAAQSIVAIGITNQRETTLLWDRKTGRPVAPAIVWQDRRTAERCRKLREAGFESEIRNRTGLVPDPYFCATKLEWMLASDSGLRSQAQKGELAFGTVDSYLVSRMTGNGRHATDVTNASRTLLYNIHELKWDERLCDLFSVPRSVLPEVLASTATFGHTKGMPGLPDGIPICGIGGDQQAALFGQACFSAGEAKCTYGTGAFMLLNTGTTPVPSSHGLLTTIAWQIGGKTWYALEGAAFIAGALVQWLRDGLGIIDSAAEIEALAQSVPDSGGVVVVPAFVGLGAPHWRPEARGTISGLTRGTTAAHIGRASLEAIALQNADILVAMAKDAGKPLSRLKVDGGAAQNDLLMQFQSDILDVEIVRPTMVETTALGAAMLAGLGVGLFANLEQLATTWQAQRTFSPNMSAPLRSAHLTAWANAVKRA